MIKAASPTTFLQVLEYSGAGVLSRLLTRLFGGVPLPSVMRSEFAEGYTQEALDEAWRDSRYFLISNLGRIGLLLPLLIGFWFLPHPGPFWIIAVQCLIHLLVAWAETYRMLAVRWFRADPQADPPSSPDVWESGWFPPRDWESERLYKSIGVDWFRKLVTTYIEWARQTKKSPDDGNVVYLKSPNRQAIDDFEAGTRQTEIVHLVLFALELVPVYIVVREKVWWLLPWCLYLAWGHLYLSLLQRYHRVRIWPVVSRHRARESGR